MPGRGRAEAIARAGAIGALALLSACATRKEAGPPGQPHYKIGAPYEVDGKRYVPQDDPTYEAIGIASWYGDDFQGKRTANGEIFDKNRLSAAHPTLPMPSLVEVENLETGRKVILRVNDRGPFAGNRVIDVSHAAARALGFERQGLATVRVRYVGRADLFAQAQPAGRGAGEERPATRAANASASSGSQPQSAGVADDPLGRFIEAALAAPVPQIWIAIADYADLNQLEKARVALAAGEGFRVVSAPPGRYELQIGPQLDEPGAATRLAQLREAGYTAARLVSDAF
jgi:rare lipoprotein A